MPKRSTSHQLEDISIQRFQALLPRAWVCRRKDKDYGVDLEVEIFNDDGDPTGLVLFVQLKATADLLKERSVRIEISNVEYLSKFELPSLIVRYCDASQSFHYIWTSDIFARYGSIKTKTFTLEFASSDLWTMATPSAVVETMRTYRAIRHLSRRSAIGLSVAGQKSAQSSHLFDLNVAVSRIIDSSKMVINSTNPDECLPIKVSIVDGYLCAFIDVIASIKFKMNEVTRDEIFGNLIYLVSFMAGRYEFVSQSINLSQIIISNRLICVSREISSYLACFILEKPRMSAEICSINKIHEFQDHNYALYLNKLLGIKSNNSEKRAAVCRFYDEALIAHSKAPPSSRAAIYYSYGNFFNNNGEYLASFRQYNKARKEDPSYCSREYFLCESASVSFFSKKFRISGFAYEIAYSINQDSKIAICAGDAFLYGGSFGKALHFFKEAIASPNPFYSSEGSLKLWLSEWIQENYFTLSCDLASISRVEFWVEKLKLFDIAQNKIDALGASLMISFQSEGDIDSWAQSLSIAFETGNPSYIAAVLSCAISRFGYEPYALVRDMLLKNNVPLEVLVGFDEVAEQMVSQRITGDGDVMVRFGAEASHFDTAPEP